MVSAATTIDVVPASRLRGRVRVPGDKSLSHRYALLAAIADGVSTIDGFAPGADGRATLACLAALGVSITRDDHPSTGDVRVRVEGRGLGGLGPPGAPLDAQNSGTTLRLLAGLLAAHPFTATLTGDASLRRRPMRRIIEPLTRMGARFSSAGGCPPLDIRGGALRGIDEFLPIASAQVTTSLLLAGLHATGRTRVTEPAPTRDHTEHALHAFGVDVDRSGRSLSVLGGQQPRALNAVVAGDPSSAAFWAVAAAALPGSEIEIVDVGLNPTRLVWAEVLRRAGADVEVILERNLGGEPCGRLRVRSRPLVPFVIEPAEVPLLIDELPALGALAALGAGMRVTGAGELRVKESDRIAGLVGGLRALGADATELSDGFEIGPSRPTLTAGCADSLGDHRLAMAFAVVMLGAPSACRLEGAAAIDVSYPAFFDHLAALRDV